MNLAQRAKRRVPASLAVLLVIVGIVGVAWALLVPAWQHPDEPVHYAYVEGLVARHALPGHSLSTSDLSSDVGLSIGLSGFDEGTLFSPFQAGVSWFPSEWATYLAELRAHRPSRVDGTGVSYADYPPLYYLYASIAYELDRGGTTFGRLYGMRLLGVVLLEFTTLGAWLLAGELFGRRRLLQLPAGAATGLTPMVVFMSTAVNPDALLMTLWSLSLWLGVRVIRRGGQAWDLAGLCAATAGAILTKPTSDALLPAVAVALCAAWLRTPPGARTAMLARIAKACTLLVVPVIAWLVIEHSAGFASAETVGGGSAAHPASITEFLSYLWQFYLPRLPFMHAFRTTAAVASYSDWATGGIGTFGWLTLPLPAWAYSAGITVAGLLAAIVVIHVISPAARLSALVFAGFVGAVIAALALTNNMHYAASVPAVAIVIVATNSVSRFSRRALRTERAVLLLYICAAVVGLLAVVHVSGYITNLGGGGQFLQGRYLLPLAGVFGLVVAVPASYLSTRSQAAWASLVLVALLGLQAVALATVLGGFYL